MVHVKRYQMPGFWGMGVKERTFAVVPKGAHPLKESIPLSVVLRNVLGQVKTRKEAETILHQEKVLVNKKVRKQGSHGVGLMDVVEIPDLKKVYRVELMRKGLALRETKTADKRLGRIAKKTRVKGGKTQLNLHDGTNLLAEGAYKSGDSILISIPENKVLAHYPLKKGADVIVTGGSKRGVRGSLVSVAERKSMVDTSTVVINTDGKTIETLTKYVFVVGGEKA